MESPSPFQVIFLSCLFSPSQVQQACERILNNCDLYLQGFAYQLLLEMGATLPRQSLPLDPPESRVLRVMLSEPKDAIAGLLELQQLFYHGVAGDFPGLYFRALYWCYTRGNRTELAQLIKILLFDKQSEVYAVNLLNTLPLTEFGSELQEVGTMQYAWLRSVRCLRYQAICIAI